MAAFYACAPTFAIGIGVSRPGRGRRGFLSAASTPTGTEEDNPEDHRSGESADPSVGHDVTLEEGTIFQPSTKIQATDSCKKER